MSKTLLTLLAMAACASATFATAGTYTDNFEVNKICDTYAEYSQLVYERNGLLGGSGRGTLDGYEHEVAMANERYKNKDGVLLDIRLFGANYVYKRATSAHDAHMATWAHCQDLFSAPAPRPRGKSKPK